MFVMNLSAMTMLLPLAQMPIQNGGTGMKTMLWDILDLDDRQGLIASSAMQ